MPAETPGNTLALTRELADQLQRQGIAATIGTDALSLGHAVVAVDVDGDPYVLSALYDDMQELSWTITDPGTHADRATGSLQVATVVQAAAHLRKVIALHADAAPEQAPPKDPRQLLVAALAAAGHHFERWSSPTNPLEWLSAPTADGGEILIEDGTGRLPRSMGTYAGLRARYSPVADEDFEVQEAVLFESPGLGHPGTEGAARFAADLDALVLAVTVCRRMAEARTSWESLPQAPHPTAARYHRAVDGLVRLRVMDVAVVLGAEELAMKLFEHYAVAREQGAQLPVELELADLLRTVAFRVEECAAGRHRREDRIGASTEREVRSWATMQVDRLLPYLTWNPAD